MSSSIREPFARGWRALRRAKRLVFLVSMIDALVCLPPVLYVAVAVHRSAAGRIDSTQLARTLDLDFMADLRRSGGEFDAVLTALVVGSLLLFFVVRPLVYGGYVGIAAAGHRLRFDQFVRNGGALYWKFFRLAVIGALAAYLLSLAAAPLLEYIDDQAASAVDEATPLRYRRITEVVVFAAFWMVGTMLDYARVGTHLFRRPGVLAELGRSALFVLQHPVRTLGFSACVFALEVGSVWLFARLLRAADGAYLITSVVTLVLIQALVALREATRLFHLAGAWQIRLQQERGIRADGALETSGPDDLLLLNLPWND